MNGSPPGARVWWLWTAIGSLVLFVAMTWPLPRHWTEGIASSAQNIEHPPARMSISGDHLQLLYHFDLVDDMLSGRIPWFHNPWEFNTGDDAARYRPGGYFLPMSGVYALLKRILGQAGAWNATQWISVWLSAAFSALWLRRFGARPLPVALGVLVILLVPFRWVSLMGGSPAGIALMWVPLLALRLDIAVERPTLANGVWLGLPMLLAFWADLQVFYFAMLTLPVLALISLGWRWEACLRNWKNWWRLAPGVLGFLLVIGLFYVWRKSHLSASTMEAGRSWGELALFSPRLRDLLWHGRGARESVYLGWGVAVALAVSLGLALRRLILARAGDRIRPALYVLVFLALILGIFLSAGPYGPRDGLAIRIAREHVPYYDMIRQPFKIFAVAPLWLGWLLTVSFGNWIPWRGDRSARRNAAFGLLTAGCVLPWLWAVDVSVSLVEPRQAAYAAVAEDAASRGIERPAAVVAPLWPGDSAETSVPLHYAQRYEIRLLNGYSPVVTKDYIENVFRRLESMNQGRLTDAQIDLLLSMNVRYLLLHENMFPEKVSPFPVLETLTRLHAHPRLAPLERAGPVRAWRILEAEAARETGPADRGFRAAFPARRWELEHQRDRGGGVVVDDPNAGGGQSLRFDAGTVPGGVETREARIAPAPGVDWWVRLRGEGRLALETHGPTWTGMEQNFSVDRPDWHWLRVPIEFSGEHEPLRLRLEVREGTLDLDMVLAVAGDWPLAWSDQPIRIPAAHFFHAGYSTEDGTVVLRPEFDPGWVVFYGPRLPLPPGRYRFRFQVESDAPAGTRLGDIKAAVSAEHESGWTPVVGGEPAELEWTVPDNRPLDLRFQYSRAAEIRLKAVEINPLEPAR